MKLFIACDHAAFEAKEALRQHLEGSHPVQDLGTFTLDSVHYPNYAVKLAQEVLRHPGSRGILLCGSGIGVSIVANRFRGIRAALCRDLDDAKMCRLHNDANVICLSGRKTSIDLLRPMVDTFLTTAFEGGRHQERLDLFKELGC